MKRKKSEAKRILAKLQSRHERQNDNRASKWLAKHAPKAKQELKSKPQPQGKEKVQLWPDWKQSKTGGFLPSLLIAFVAVLAAEWGLRRYWGMV